MYPHIMAFVYGVGHITRALRRALGFEVNGKACDLASSPFSDRIQACISLGFFVDVAKCFP
jgi:hypothetical protein